MFHMAHRLTSFVYPPSSPLSPVLFPKAAVPNLLHLQTLLTCPRPEMDLSLGSHPTLQTPESFHLALGIDVLLLKVTTLISWTGLYPNSKISHLCPSPPPPYSLLTQLHSSPDGMRQFDFARSFTHPSVSKDVSRPSASHHLKMPTKNEASLNGMENPGLDPGTDKEQ